MSVPPMAGWDEHGCCEREASYRVWLDAFRNRDATSPSPSPMPIMPHGFRRPNDSRN